MPPPVAYRIVTGAALADRMKGAARPAAVPTARTCLRLRKRFADVRGGATLRSTMRAQRALVPAAERLDMGSSSCPFMSVKTTRDAALVKQLSIAMQYAT